MMDEIPVYLDHNATTPLDPRVREAMKDLLDQRDCLANPSSIHRLGQRARGAVEAARRKVARAVGAEPLGVTFTSGGTEANNLAIVGSARALRAAGKPAGVLTSPLEHPSVLEPVKALGQAGHPVRVLSCDTLGRIAPQQLSALLREDPRIGLVTLSAANHEIGNAYNIPALVAAARAAVPRVVFHCDAVQALGKLPVGFEAWDLDLLTLSSHKIRGPQGVGALVHRRHTDLVPLVRGGRQERGNRPGTEATLLIHGLGAAAEIAAREQARVAAHTRKLRARLVAGLAALDGVEVHGDQVQTTGNTVNARFDGCDGQMLAIALDLAGYAVSTGSACTTGNLEPSAVLLALGCTEAEARSSLRISLGRSNDAEEVEGLLEALAHIVAQVRGAREIDLASGDGWRG